MRRMAGVVAAIGIMSGAVQATAAPLPDWMLGDWSVEKTYQDRYMPYAPQGGPAVWWQDKKFHVGKDRLAFADWVCQGPHATLRHGSVAKLVYRETVRTLDDIGMPEERQPAAYYAISCDRSMIWQDAFQGQPGSFHDIGIDMPWFIVVRSRSEIAMPFQAASFVVFARAAPSA